LVLGALPTAPSCAREVSRVQLDSWGLNSMADEVVAVVSELVTNAVQACSDGNPPRQLRFRMSLIGSRVRVEVWDPEPDPPEMLEDVEPDAGVGRGLRIVDTLTGGRWGSAAAPDVGGKVVWAELAPGHGD
jgi:anti-sigma regulatory factor (Ser/Thr protein kinase)